MENRKNEREREREAILNSTINKYVLELLKDINPQIQETQVAPVSIKKIKSTARTSYIVPKTAEHQRQGDLKKDNRKKIDYYK